MKDLIIACENSFGLDVKRIILAINLHWEKCGWGTPYRIKGYIGKNNLSDNLKNLMSPYLGNIEEWTPAKDEYFVMGIIEPHSKKKAVEWMKARGAQFETLWAPWVMVHTDFKFPEGCIIAAQSIMDSAQIGCFVTLYHSMVGFDAIVGDYSSVMVYANITTSHIGECVLIEDNGVVIGKRINNDAVVKANSVVVREVKAGIVVSGNPAKRITLLKRRNL